jgi:hypothetical protein
MAIIQDRAWMPGLDPRRRNAADAFRQIGCEPVCLAERDLIKVRIADDDAQPPVRREEAEAVVRDWKFRFVLLNDLATDSRAASEILCTERD